MDHGPGAHHRLLETGHRAVDVTHAFFTHLHYDHCMDYGRLVLQRWDQGADKVPDLEVYGPPPIKRMTDLLFGEDGVYGPDIRARIEHRSSIDQFVARGGTAPRKRPAPRVREIRAGDVVEGKAWKLTVGHFQPAVPPVPRVSPRHPTARYATRATAGRRRIVALAKNCDILIHMNHYFSGTAPSPAYRAACESSRQRSRRGAPVFALVLTPCSDRSISRELRRIVHEFSRCSREVVWGEGKRLTFAGPAVTNIEADHAETPPRFKLSARGRQPACAKQCCRRKRGARAYDRQRAERAAIERHRDARHAASMLLPPR
jgi:hypothetical protein